MRATMVTMAVLLLTASGCPAEAPREPPKAAPAPPAPAPRPADAGPAKPKLGPAPTDGLSLVERIAKKKAEQDKLADELAGQEKERLLKYDKTKLAQHNAVFAFLKKARKALDDAAGKAKGKPDAKDQLDKLVASQRKGIEAQGKTIQTIDPKGGNSNIVTDEDVMLNLLANEYPQAIAASFDGDEKPLTEQTAEMDKRSAKIEEWLGEVKKTK